MLNSAPPLGRSAEPEDEAIDRIVSQGPRGALALAGLTTAMAVAIWFAFYLLVFVPRGPLL